MKKKKMFLLLFLLSLSASLIIELKSNLLQAQGIEKLTIISQGQSDYTIVIGQEATPVEEFAAQELQKYLLEIAGVELPIKRDYEVGVANLIVIGSQEVNEKARELGVVIDNGYLGEDGFIIKTIEDNLILAGVTSRGNLYAVYDYLESLGCRWFYPDVKPEDQVIPQLTDVIVAGLDVTVRPDFSYRMSSNEQTPPHELILALIDWSAKKKCSHHVLQGELPSSQVMEIEKRGLKFKISQHDFLVYVSDDPVAFVRQNPAVDAIALWPADGIGCDTDEYIRTVCHWAKRIASEVNPEIEVEALVQYGGTYYDRLSQEILSQGLPDNVTLCWAWREAGINRYDPSDPYNPNRLKDLKNWLSFGNMLYNFEYYPDCVLGGIALSPYATIIAKEAKDLETLGSSGFELCSVPYESWWIRSLNEYWSNKLMWNSQLTAEELISDYCDHYFKSASQPMQEFLSDYEKKLGYTDHPRKMCILTEELDDNAFAYTRYWASEQYFLDRLAEIEQLESYLSQAQSLAGADPILNRRINKWSALLTYLKGQTESGLHRFRGYQYENISSFEEAIAEYSRVVNIEQELWALAQRWEGEGLFGDMPPEYYQQATTYYMNKISELGGNVELDNTPPNPPTDLISPYQTASSISLSWTEPFSASDGDVASYYKVLRDNFPLGTTTGTTYLDTGLTQGTTFSYSIYSVDDAGNQSLQPATGSFNTLASGSSDTTPPDPPTNVKVQLSGKGGGR